MKTGYLTLKECVGYIRCSIESATNGKKEKKPYIGEFKRRKIFQKERGKHLKMKIEFVLAAAENIIRMNKPKVMIVKIQ